MDRSDILLCGMGGAGGRLTNEITNVDSRFVSVFINTSLTDMESLDNYDKDLGNGLCLGTSNGVGRNRELAKKYAEHYGNNIIDLLQKYQQKNIFIITSFGGGSGSTLSSALLNTIDDIGKDELFEGRTINLIGILPDLKSSDKILRNCIETWNEIIGCECINAKIFIDNNTKLFQTQGDEKELSINEKFANLFDSIFDIPVDNGINFDNMNLGNILTDKGSLYFYELEDDCTSIEVAYSKAKKNSVMPPIYVPEGQPTINCGYMGFSFANENYNQEVILDKFTPSNEKEVYRGSNADDKNLFIVSGLMPPMDAIGLINYELKEREKNTQKEAIDVSKFIIEDVSSKVRNETAETTSVPKTKKKLKKNLFKR